MPKSETNPHLQAAIMEVVDNQLRSNDPPQTQQTYASTIVMCMMRAWSKA